MRVPDITCMPSHRLHRFEDVRTHLFNQFQSVCYQQESGLDPDALRQEIDAHCAAHASLPAVVQKAHAYRIIVTRAHIALDPHDRFADKLNHAGILRDMTAVRLNEAEAGPVQTENAWRRQAFNSGCLFAELDLGHISPGWEQIFAGGLTGLLHNVDTCRRKHGAALTPEQSAFYHAVSIVYSATITLAGRFENLACSLVDYYPECAENLQSMAHAMQRVPAYAPRTLREALQSVWFMHELIEMEGEYVRSMGHIDRLLYPYYQADIQAGRVTPDEAKELLKFFWMKWYARTRGRDNGKNFLLGGQRADGTDACNDFTWLVLEAYREYNAPDPKLSVRFFPGSPARLYTTAAALIRDGFNSIVLINDEAAIPALVKRGKRIEDARRFIAIGCYEPAVDGKEVACTSNIFINLAKGVELLLHNGADPLSGWQAGPHTGDPRSFTSFQQVYDAYIQHMSALLDTAASITRAYERCWPAVNPSPVIAGTIEGCLETGNDIGQGGARYNSTGCVGVALANAADSLTAIKQAVFDERFCTMDELISALDADFNGFESLQQYLVHRVPKWGNNNHAADRMAVDIAEWYCRQVHTYCNERGGSFQAALYSVMYRRSFGRSTGALPDGRSGQVSLAPSINPMPGNDRHGISALINSACMLDFTSVPNGSVLDLMLHPSAVQGNEGLAAFVALITSYFAKGGYALQCNCVSPEQLRAAQRHPDQYASLLIRVTGWSVYFTSLSRDEQDYFIARAAHKV